MKQKKKSRECLPLETEDFNNKSEKEIWSSVGNGRR